MSGESIARDCLYFFTGHEHRAPLAESVGGCTVNSRMQALVLLFTYAATPCVHASRDVKAGLCGETRNPRLFVAGNATDDKASHMD